MDYKIKLFYPFLFLLFLNKAFAQQVDGKYRLNELSSYKYIHKVINADSLIKNIPLVIGLHWYGSTPSKFAKYLEGFKIPVRLILVQGTYPCDSGYSFFICKPKSYYELSNDDKMFNILNEGDRLSKFIEAITAFYKPSIKPVIIGASQGGDLCYLIGIKYSFLISQSCPLLATIDNRIIIPFSKSMDVPSRIDAFHGTADPIVNVDTAQRNINLLSQNGYRAYLHTYRNIRHDISASMKKDYITLIEKILSKQEK